jgi:DNA-binding transcriptional ArsR family regulator
MAQLLPHPETHALDLPTVMHALSDPARLAIVGATDRATRGPDAADDVHCGSIDLPLAPATVSHHLRVLREAGVTQTRVDGRLKYISLRRADLDARFPGLLDGVLASIHAQQPAALA